MSGDAVVIGLLTGLVVAKGLYSVWLTVQLKRAHLREEDLRLQVIKLNRNSSLKSGEVAALKDLMDALSKPKAFDQKTNSLIKMAISNANENESRSAAVQACKRIAKQLGVK